MTETNFSNSSSVIEISDGSAKLSRDLLDSCIHCGLCLPACPTYLATGREMESPRGRIYLLSKWQEEGGELAPRAIEHLESCLGCLGCQTACPSGVKYEAILDQARPHLAARRNWLTRQIMRFSFSQLLPYYGRLKILGSVLRLVQTLKLDGFVANLPFVAKGPPLLRKITDFQMFTPTVAKHLPLPKKSWKAGVKTGNAQLFSGCVMDVFYNHVNHAALRLMVRQGTVVEVPVQTCCGALAFHAGELDIATNLAKQNIDLFAASEEKIVVTSAGCGAMLKHYGDLLEGDVVYKERALLFSKRVQDISENLALGKFPVMAGTAQTDRDNSHIVYHAACHLAHAQGVRVQPQELLTAAAASTGAHLYDLPEAEHCCGSAGIYNLLNTALSLKVLDRKMNFIEESGADVVVTSNPGCLLQLEAGVKARGLNVKVKHLAEALDDAFAN
ncbi:MAG: heterodisulfide reductase-related iron-sulfur binding cluster [Candidatus Melainabacteria bacterium]|nr:heterodisulfide reductase-related iron-sulfur binding cluster [Candidatus Melainabacteria bacterium]